MIEAVNDFVVKFANVNGSGSASANELFAKSILRMGVPVSPRNIFPSNIQGLPTWYEVRVTEAGFLGRRGGVDLLVAMNPQTWDKDLLEIEPGGYLLYDDSKPLPPSKFRPDVNVIGVPLTRLCADAYSNPRERQLLKNIVYVGCLAALLGIEPKVVTELIGEQYKGKEQLLGPNVAAFQMGHDYATANLAGRLGLSVRRADAVGDRIFAEGNAATALGCVYGGATVCAWYPITPSSSVAEAFAGYCRKFRVEPETGRQRHAIVQAEDELASIGVVVGAGWNGARAFTATSGPGVSLMTEFIGLAYFAEVPVTIVDVQRGGPSTGMPTRTQQADLIACAYASHGDTKHPMLLPEDPTECFGFAALALDLADRLQTPVFLMTDLDIGMNHRLCRPFEWDDARQYDRGKVMDRAMLDAGIEFGRYLDVDGDGIPFRTLPGTHPTRGAYFTRGTTKNRYAAYSETGPDYVDNVQRLLRKFETARKLVPGPVIRLASGEAGGSSGAVAPVASVGAPAGPVAVGAPAGPGGQAAALASAAGAVEMEPVKVARFGVIYFGSTSPAMDEAVGQLAEAGIGVDLCRLRGFPFAESVALFIAAHERVFVVEQNRDAQMRTLLINELEIDPARLVAVLHYDGTPITARFISGEIRARIEGRNVTPLERVHAA